MKRAAAAIGAAAAALALLALAGSAFGHPDLLAIVIRGSVGSRFALDGTLAMSRGHDDAPGMQDSPIRWQLVAEHLEDLGLGSWRPRAGT